MRIEQLLQFIEIAHFGNISKAAEKLYLSEPNLSISIKRLEEEIGKKLFTRTTTGLYLTEFGKEFLVYAKNVQRDFLSLQNFCKLEQDTPLNFSIAMTPQHWIYQLFADFTKRYEQQAINFSLSTPDGIIEILRMVLSGEIDLAIVSLSTLESKHMKQLLKKKKIEFHHLAEGQFSILVGRNNPYFSSDITSLTLDMIKAFPFVVIGEELNCQHRMLYNEVGLLQDARSIITVNSSGAMHKILETSSAVALSIHYQQVYKSIEYNRNLRAIPLAGLDSSFELGWIRAEDHIFSPIAQEFIQSLNQLMEQGK